MFTWPFTILSQVPAMALLRDPSVRRRTKVALLSVVCPSHATDCTLVGRLRIAITCTLTRSSLDSLQSSSSIPSCAGTSPRLHSAHQLLSNSRRPGRDDPLILDRLLGRQGFSFFFVFLYLFIFQRFLLPHGLDETYLLRTCLCSSNYCLSST